ncbi:hypothetical protein GGI15_000289 [Coemansia interrupta]|uniref:Trafficking protein particle complex subunit 8 n=1 Tax=Coemansia interrupta TaxID=1126814 RepID=A0A9W8LPN5_9FUNG|nr:hypothetical protein GGI15_000289 [Coemansia interrupta]
MPRAGLAQKKEFVAKALCPRILLIASPDIHDACSVNGLQSPADLLAPFGQDVSAQITIQDGQGAPYFLDKINVRFISDFIIEKQQQQQQTKLTNADVDDLVTSCIGASSAAEHADPSFMSLSSGIDKKAAAHDEVSAWSPWYTLFRQQWVNRMQPSEHESFMHPVACLLVVSGSDPDPVGSLRSLSNHPTVRRAQTQSFAGTNLLLYYMVLHDERRTTDAHNVDHRFDQVRKTFGQHCSLLRINSNTDLLEPEGTERSKISAIWSSHLASTQPLAGPSGPSADKDVCYGSMLSMRDVSAMRDAVKQMMVRSVVPHMQYVVRLLSDQTASQRRGITGRLFSAGRRYFGNASKANVTSTGTDGDMYFRYDSPEAMMRLLADYSFMLKDFRFAQSVYQVARRDFLAEKAWKCYAGAQEMVGLCKLMWEIQATKAEFDSNFEDAIVTYMTKTHAPRPFLAIRSVVLYYELLKHHRMYTFAPVALLRIPSTFVSLSALMNEQAAYAYLKFPVRPEVRKFSFYAMIASQLYQRAGLGSMAHRCLRMVRVALLTPATRERRTEDDDEGISGSGENEKSAVAVNEKQGLAAEDAKDATTESGASTDEVIVHSRWAAIDSFINHELGRQCMAAQNYDEAFQYFMALMGDDKIPPKLQSKYLQELLQLFLESDDRAASADAPESQSRQGSVQLSIPNIDPNLARIIMSPSLEGDDGLLDWPLDGSAPAPAEPSVSASSDHGRNGCCSVGEVVAVLLVVTNPLTIGVTLNNFTLDCRFSSTDGSVDSDSDSEPDFEVTTVPSVILEGGQTTMVTVEIVARRSGELSIVGAKYLLCDILPTFKSLRLPGRRLNNTKEQQTGTVYSPDSTLGFRVDPSLSHLHITMHDMPDTLMSGSVHQASIHIENRGALPCQNIAIWLSHPSFFDIKSPHMFSKEDVSTVSQEVYPKQSGAKDAESTSVQNTLQDCSEFLLVGDSKQQLLGARHLTPIDCLEPGQTLVVPLWARGDRVGAHSLSLVVGANTEAVRPGSLSRVMRSRTFDVDLLVTPSLRVNAFVRPSTLNPHERLLGIEVENMQPDLSVQLVQTTFSSGNYKLAPISVKKYQETAGSKVVVGPRQTISLMFRASPHETGSEGSEDRSMQQKTTPEHFTINALRQYIYSNDKPKQHPGSIDLIYSNTVLGDHDGIDCVHSSLHSYILRSQAHRRRNMLRANYPMIPEKFYPALFPLFETFGIDFVLFWTEDGGQGRSGHHSITGIDLGVPYDYVNEALNPPSEGVGRAWLANTINERELLIQSIANRPSVVNHRNERPLDVTMRVAAVNSDPSTTGSDMHVVEVMVTIQNHSWRYGYQAELSLISPADLEQLVGEQVRLDYSGPRSAWSWIGKTDFLLAVDAQRSVVVTARLACMAPGMIDIGLWKLRASALEPGSGDESGSVGVPAVRHPYSSKSLECVVHPIMPSFVTVGPSAE